MVAETLEDVADQIEARVSQASPRDVAIVVAKLAIALEQVGQLIAFGLDYEATDLDPPEDPAWRDAIGSFLPRAEDLVRVLADPAVRAFVG